MLNLNLQPALPAFIMPSHGSLSRAIRVSSINFNFKGLDHNPEAEHVNVEVSDGLHLLHGGYTYGS